MGESTLERQSAKEYLEGTTIELAMVSSCSCSATNSSKRNPRPHDEEDTLALVESGEEDHFCDAEGSVNTSIDSDTSVITVLECQLAEHERDKA